MESVHVFERCSEMASVYIFHVLPKGDVSVRVERCYADWDCVCGRHPNVQRISALPAYFNRRSRLGLNHKTARRITLSKEQAVPQETWNWKLSYWQVLPENLGQEEVFLDVTNQRIFKIMQKKILNE